MAWIESHQHLEKNGKLLTLANKLQINRYQAIGHLHALWWWALDNAEDGNIGRFHESVITKAAGWDEYVQEDWEVDSAHCLSTAEAYAIFVPALIETGFLDKTPDGLMIHAWEMYTHRYFRSVTKSAEQREKVRERVRRHRRSNAGVTQVKRDVTPPTVPNRTIPNQTKDNSNDNDSARATPNFIQPTDFKPPSIVPQRAAPLTRQAPPQEFGIHVDFVRQFGAVYASRTGEPFNATPSILRIAKRMIDTHGLAVTVRKAQMLGEACENRDKWFTKEEGWAEFTIETLDAKWNRLIFKEKIDPKAKADDDLLKELKKLEEERERTNNAARR